MSIDMPTSEDHLVVSTHRAVWALGDYALMAEQVMAPLGPLLVAAAGIGPGVRVLDVAAGSGNISLPGAKTGASRSNPSPAAPWNGSTCFSPQPSGEPDHPEFGASGPALNSGLYLQARATHPCRGLRRAH